MLRLFVLCLSIACTSVTAFLPYVPRVGICGNSVVFGQRDYLESEGGEASSIAVLICPAQFCVPADYDSVVSHIQASCSSVTSCSVAPLPRTEWIKVARQLPTTDFFQANLSVPKTLQWYFDAIDSALADIFAENPDSTVCFVGHSIGGWVARAFLGGMSRGPSTATHRLAQERCTSLITLGTPHASPSDALVDQTRGLLSSIACTPACSAQALADRGINVTCVGSSGMSGSFFSLDVERLVAASSYLPLTGKVNVKGDGIVPLELVFMEEPARSIVLDEKIRHAHVLPTPWNLWNAKAPSILLPTDVPSYVSKDIVPLWSKYIV